MNILMAILTTRGNPCIPSHPSSHLLFDVPVALNAREGQMRFPEREPGRLMLLQREERGQKPGNCVAFLARAFAFTIGEFSLMTVAMAIGAGSEL